MDALALQRDGEGWRIDLRGDWSLEALPRIDLELEALPAAMSGTLVCDWSRVEHPGIAPVWALLTRLSELGSERQLAVRHEGNPAAHRAAAAKAAARALHRAWHARRWRCPTAKEWSRSSDAGRCCRERKPAACSAFSGASPRFSGRASRVRGSLRLPSIARHVHETGVSAIPIVSLIAFLISVVVAYLGAQQLARFGATIFVVDLVTIAVLREMGVLLTAIIVAGRSGSAFAAEIGVMQLNEEIDALRAMGMNPIELLVVPRVIGLVIALPCLTVIADAMGLAGGGLLSLVQLHIPPAQFTIRMREALSSTTFWAGMVKAPVFALLIGMVGAYRGMQVRDSARELGRLTTMAVVQSIFLVILADAFFAVLFEQIDF